MLFEANCIYLVLVNLAVIEFDTSNAALKCYVVGCHILLAWFVIAMTLCQFELLNNVSAM